MEKEISVTVQSNSKEEETLTDNKRQPWKQLSDEHVVNHRHICWKGALGSSSPNFWPSWATSGGSDWAWRPSKMWGFHNLHGQPVPGLHYPPRVMLSPWYSAWTSQMPIWDCFSLLCWVPLLKRFWLNSLICWHEGEAQLPCPYSLLFTSLNKASFLNLSSWILCSRSLPTVTVLCWTSPRCSWSTGCKNWLCSVPATAMQV